MLTEASREELEGRAARSVVSFTQLYKDVSIKSDVRAGEWSWGWRA